MSKPNVLLQKNSPIKILLVENIHETAKEKLIAEGYHVDLLTHAPSEEEYLKILVDWRDDFATYPAFDQRPRNERLHLHATRRAGCLVGDGDAGQQTSEVEVDPIPQSVCVSWVDLFVVCCFDPISSSNKAFSKLLGDL